MKQHFLSLAIILALCINSLYGQQEDKLVSLGIKAGVNLTSVVTN